MNLKVFAVRDAKMEAFLPPFFMLTFGMAIRAFEEECKRDGSEFAKHPGDYEMFHVGEYDQVTGRVEPCQPVQLATGLQVTSSRMRVEA